MVKLLDYFYDNDDLDHCPKCNEPRYKTKNSKSKSKTPRKFVFALDLPKELSKRVQEDPDFLKVRCYTLGLLSHLEN